MSGSRNEYRKLLLSLEERNCSEHKQNDIKTPKNQKEAAGILEEGGMPGYFGGHSGLEGRA
jgi:hypothetical protein